MKAINEEEKDLFQLLKQIPNEELQAKQAAIEKIAPRLQFSIIPKHIGDGSNGATWTPPFTDAGSVIIDRILDRQTVEPIRGFTDHELLTLVNKQNEIMDFHEDYAPMRPEGKTGGMGNKEQIAKGTKGISKILTDATIQYPSWGALILSKDFIPEHIFKETDVIEYQKGRVSYISNSKRFISKEKSLIAFQKYKSLGGTEIENNVVEIKVSRPSKNFPRKRSDRLDILNKKILDFSALMKE